MNKCGSHSLDLAVSSLQGNKIDSKTILSHFDACPSTFTLHIGYEQNSQLTCFLYSHHDKSNMCSATLLFSFPWSDLTREGRPCFSTASKK